MPKWPRAAQRYIENFLGGTAAEQVAVDPIFLQAHVKQLEFAEVVDTSVGPMHEIHALLGFDQQAQDHFREQWRNVLVADRLQKTAPPPRWESWPWSAWPLCG